MSNLNLNFQAFLMRKQIKEETDIEQLKKVTLQLLKENEMLKEMLKRELAISLGIDLE